MRRKSIILVCILFAGSMLPAHLKAQGSKSPKLFKKECVLLYEVNFDNRNYLFNIRIDENSKKGLIFDWFMTSNSGMSGKVKVAPEALQSATSYLNYFNFKSDYVLNDKSCVWLAKDVFQKLKAGEKVSLDLGEGLTADFQLVKDKTSYLVPVSVRYGDIYGVSAIRIEAENGKYFMYILDNPEDPVILYMDLNSWYVRLIGIM